MPTRVPLGLAREDAEPFPSAHLPDTFGRQVRQPVVDARMRLGLMVAMVVGGDEACQPTVRLCFGLGFVEMVECLVRVLDRAEWPLDLAFGARRRPPPIGSGGHVRMTSTPRLSITRLNTADFATGPLSRWIAAGMPWNASPSPGSADALSAMALNRKRSAVSTSSP